MQNTPTRAFVYISFLCRNRCFGYVKWIYEAETLECVCVCVCESVCVCSRAYACRENTSCFVLYFFKNQSKIVSRAALDGSRDQRNRSFYDVNWTFCKKGCVFAREWRTSMSPRSNEKHTFFENWNMYGAVCRFFSCGACGPFRVLKMMHWNYNLVFSSLLDPISPPKRLQNRLKTKPKKTINFNVPWIRFFDGFWNENDIQKVLITATFLGKVVLPIFEGCP